MEVDEIAAAAVIGGPVRWVSGLLLGVVVAWSGSVLAMHDVDHRFTVFGYVKDQQGNPVADARVIIRAEKLGEGMTAFTDRQGYYTATLHLHDKDLGEPLEIMTGDDTQRINAEFNVNDKATERRVEVTFGPSPATAAAATPATRHLWVWAALAVTAAIGTAAIYARSRRGTGGRGQSKQRRA